MTVRAPLLLRRTCTSRAPRSCVHHTASARGVSRKISAEAHTVWARAWDRCCQSPPVRAEWHATARTRVHVDGHPFAGDPPTPSLIPLHAPASRRMCLGARQPPPRSMTLALQLNVSNIVDLMNNCTAGIKSFIKSTP